MVAMYHFNSKLITRSKGQSVIASVAYCAGEKIFDERLRRDFDFSRKENVIHSEILLPAGAPSRFLDRGILWNEVEKIENRKDAQLAREIEAAIPIELDEESRLRLVMDFLREEIVSQGMIADFSLHDLKGNPHFHALLSMREVNEEGFGKKNRDWNRKEFLESLRERWAAHVNRAMERAGIDQRVDHRSFKDQGRDEIPTIHEGFRKGKLRDARIDYNRRVKYWNLKHNNLKTDVKNLTKKRDSLSEIIDKVIKKSNSHLNKIGRIGLKNPSSKTKDAIKKLFELALAGNEEAKMILGFHAGRINGKEDWKDWQYMTQADRDAARLRKIYSDDY